MSIYGMHRGQTFISSRAAYEWMNNEILYC